MNFHIFEKDGMARTGVVETRSGSFNVPAFIPVATSGAVRSLDSRDLESMGVEVVFANTYHLYLRPGEDLVKRISSPI